MKMYISIISLEFKTGIFMAIKEKGYKQHYIKVAWQIFNIAVVFVCVFLDIPIRFLKQKQKYKILKHILSLYLL